MVAKSLTTIVFYQRGNNGKFIVNCLGLGKNAVLQDADIATKQMNKQMSQHATLGELLRRLEATGDEWEDLGLGCSELFGYNATSIKKDSVLSATAYEADAKGYRTFIIAHGTDELRNALTVLPDADLLCVAHPNFWLTDLEATLAYVKILYMKYNITGYDSELITTFYNAYITKITELGRMEWLPSKYH